MPRRARPTRRPARNSLIDVLTNLSEHELTHTVLIPLLKTLGYQDVEYTGGSDEAGKDLVCWGVDEIGNTKLAVAQVKKYKPTARAADTKNFSELVTQLVQASEEPLPRLDGQVYRPSIVYFFTPFPISLRALRTRLHGIRDLYSRNLKIVDGNMLAPLLQRNLPNVVVDLCGPQEEIRDAILPQLSNDVLMRALRARTGRRLDELYTDIDLAVGQTTTRLLVDSVIDGCSVTAHVNASEWGDVRAVLTELRTIEGVDLVATINRRSEARFAREVERWQSHTLLERRLADVLAEASTGVLNAYGTLASFRDCLSAAGVNLNWLCEPIVRTSSERAKASPSAWKTAIEQTRARLTALQGAANSRVEPEGFTLATVVEAWVKATVDEHSVEEERRESFRLNRALAAFSGPLSDKGIELARLRKPVEEIAASRNTASAADWARALRETQVLVSKIPEAANMRLKRGGTTLANAVEGWAHAAMRESTAGAERRRLASLSSCLAAFEAALASAGVDLKWLREPIDRIRADQGRPAPADWKAAGELIRWRLSKLQQIVSVQTDSAGPTLASAVESWLQAVAREQTIREEQRQLPSEKEPAYTLDLNGKGLAEYLRRQQEWLRTAVRRLNSKRTSARHSLKGFLDRCGDLFRISALAFGNAHIRACLGVDESVSSNLEHNELRLTIPTAQLFAAGKHLALFGGAGAGKTTALQKYALDCCALPDSEVLTLFVPLARIADPAPRLANTPSAPSPGQSLEDRIAAYISTLGTPISSATLRHELQERRAVLLLDGIDEAIGRFPELIKAMDALAKRYPRTQIITSSRTSGGYISQIPFLGVTLLPFTAEQRDAFIRSWFKGHPKRPAVRILNHLRERPDLAQNVTNPLVATILCVLAESGVPLPTTEVRLYDERLRLLLGYYDLHKQIQRVSSHPQDLEVMARKIAYCLHKKETREADLAELFEYARAGTAGRLSSSECKQALGELVDPCNLLVPMTTDGGFGFGHLRYQEHLAAMELAFNRGIALPPLLARSFWHGALVFYAQRADSIDEVVAGARSLGGAAYARNLVEAMINVRAEDERARLMRMLRSEGSEMADDVQFIHSGIYDYASGLEDLVDDEEYW